VFNDHNPVKNFLLFVISAIAYLSLGAPAQEVFLESLWSNTVTNSSVALWAGGNESSVGPGTANDAPHSSNNIYLIESGIGQMTSQNLGYPQASADLAQVASSARNNAEAYRFVTDGSGAIVSTNPASVWSIVFPGGFNPVDGTIYSNPAAASINFDTNMLNQAEYTLRARLRINPFDADAAQQLILLQEDRMLPLEWCGTEAVGYADKARWIGLPLRNGMTAEIFALEQARGYYQSACDVLSEFLRNPPDAELEEGLNAFVSGSVSNQVAEVLDDYLRCLGEYARASITEFQIQSLAQFYDPSQQRTGSLPSATQTLLTNIDRVYAEIQLRLLLTSPFANLPFYTANGAGQVQSLMLQLGRLHESVLTGRITFIAGTAGDSTTDKSLLYGEYTSSFIPFFNDQLTQRGTVSSFSVALGLAQNFALSAAALEISASNAVQTSVQQAYDYSTSQTELQNQYNNQLVALCGYAGYDALNKPLPDIFFAGLAPGDREAMGSSVESGYHLNETGTIYLQWQNLQQAETRLIDAQVQLSNTFALMLIKKQVADAIFSDQTNLAALILTNGQQIAAFDIQKGDIQAQADLSIGQINHDNAERQGNRSLWTGLITGGTQAAVAYASGGSSLGGQLAAGGASGSASGVSTFLAVQGAYDQASAALAIGQVQANTARQLASIDAQIAQINSQEQAQMQYVNADITMLNLSADLNALRLQAESQKVQIQLAGQGVDQERSKLATLLAQVSYLLKQFARSASLLAQNPKLADDFVIARNKLIEQADDSFLLAQQWSFLASQCFYYEDNCTADLSSKSYVTNVLAARNTATLIANLNAMASSGAVLGASCQSSISYGYRDLSLRNNVFQQNQTSGTNTVYEPVLMGGSFSTNSAASAAAWTGILQQNLSPDPVFNRKLKLQFATSVNPQKVGGVPRNPLFIPFTFGAVIHPYAQGSVQCQGIQVNIVTTGLQLAPGGVPVYVSQDGTSSIRSLAYCNPDNTFRYFNFGSFKNSITASLNGFDASLPGSIAFQDRSVANDLWTVAIVDDGANGTTILNNLDKLQDIQIRVGFRSYTDQQCGP
jgi:hypothetical protein